MGRITPVIDDGLEKRLRDYISSTREKAYGGITEVVEEALTQYLDFKEVISEVYDEAFDMSDDQLKKIVRWYDERVKSKDEVFLDQKERD